MAANTEAIRGPTYGIIFKTAHRNAMTKALSTPKIRSTTR
jgi:hypothetical protein